MKILTVTLGAITALAFSASVAAAAMEPIPNPPEKPMAHHKKHHHAAKKVEAKADDKGAMASEKKPDKK